ncbi:MAG: hypothetical protein R2697_06195 [Ilumatobacteraceae bacterium]
MGSSAETVIIEQHAEFRPSVVAVTDPVAATVSEALSATSTDVVDDLTASSNPPMW